MRSSGSRQSKLTRLSAERLWRRFPQRTADDRLARGCVVTRMPFQVSYAVSPGRTKTFAKTILASVSQVELAKTNLCLP